MSAEDVIESYVLDVARCLPKNKRNDVAFELRALLMDDLNARARAAGRAPDKAMAMELLAAFGRPAETATRYHEMPPIIAVEDTRSFLLWTLAIAVVASTKSMLEPTNPAVQDLFLKLLGVLVLIFGLIGLARRRQPKGFRWQPRRVTDPDAANRFVQLTLGLLSLIPLSMYVAPQRFVEVAFFGVVPNSGVALSEHFIGTPERLATTIALAVNAAIYFVVAVPGRWQRWTRRTLSIALTVVGLLFLWHARHAEHGRVFLSPHANEIAAPIFAGVGALMILAVLFDAYVEWARVRPAPSIASPSRA